MGDIVKRHGGNEPIRVGDVVHKPKGYPFVGTVQAVFENRLGETRLVVELMRHFDGDMLHIFSPAQLELGPGEDLWEEARAG